MLLPDTSVLIAGLNPNLEVELNVPYPTTYTTSIFYLPYFALSICLQVMDVSQMLSYGGSFFTLTVSLTLYTRMSANNAAANTTVMLSHSSFLMHAMNMGQ